MGLRMCYRGGHFYELLTENGVRIVVDPLFDRTYKRRPYHRENFEPPDLILVTHGDAADHLLDVPWLLHNTDAICIASPEVCECLSSLGNRYRIRDDKLWPVVWGDTVRVRGLQFLITKAVHSSNRSLAMASLLDRVPSPEEAQDVQTLMKTLAQIPSAVQCEEEVKAVFGVGSMWEVPRGACLGFFITTERGYTIWHTGSCTPNHALQAYARELRPNVLMVETFAGTEKTSAQVVSWIRPVFALPTHHDKIWDDLPGPSANTALFESEIKRLAPEVNVLVPEMGEWYELELACRPA